MALCIFVKFWLQTAYIYGLCNHNQMLPLIVEQVLTVLWGNFGPSFHVKLLLLTFVCFWTWNACLSCCLLTGFYCFSSRTDGLTFSCRVHDGKSLSCRCSKVVRKHDVTASMLLVSSCGQHGWAFSRFIMGQEAPLVSHLSKKCWPGLETMMIQALFGNPKTDLSEEKYSHSRMLEPNHLAALSWTVFFLSL